MKGVVFNLLESLVTEQHGPDTWDALPPNDVVRWFGRGARPMFASSYPRLGVSA
jgi:hypothetical protein